MAVAPSGRITMYVLGARTRILRRLSQAQTCATRERERETHQRQSADTSRRFVVRVANYFESLLVSTVYLPEGEMGKIKRKFCSISPGFYFVKNKKILEIFLFQMSRPIQVKPADSENRGGKWPLTKKRT